MPNRCGNNVNSDRLLSLAPKSLHTVTAAMKLKDTCSLEDKTIQYLDNVLKSRVFTVPAKVCIVKALIFSVVMHGCESWTINKVEHRRIDAFKLWCWGRLLRVPWTARRLNQSILKEINPEFIGRTDAEV